jgi:predicted  nucleic acid-binding Zn-ribbon protein
VHSSPFKARERKLKEKLSALQNIIDELREEIKKKDVTIESLEASVTEHKNKVSESLISFIPAIWYKTILLS